MTPRPLRTAAGLAAPLVATALALTACAGPSAAAAPTGAPVATVTQGQLRGSSDGAVDRWLNIPYAAPPVGDLRLAPTEPGAAWDGVRDATAPGDRCPQVGSPPAVPTPYPGSTTEDCLTLTVTTPAGGGEDLPVLVWFHGGGLRTGSAYDYDTGRLAAEGPAVVVAVNYRLGALGFLSAPDLPGGGQFGLLDQQEALRWVQRDIAAFGGDPGAVTILGESGGADAVCAQLASPAAAGLFHRAVVQSGECGQTNVVDVILPGAGPALDTWKPRELADQLGTGFAGANGCTDPATLAACLRGVPVEAFVAAGAATYFSPATGTGTLPQRPGDAFAAGGAADVPVLMGVNEAEGTLFGQQFFLESGNELDEAAFTGLLSLGAGDRAAEALAAYPLDGRSPTRAYSDMITDRAYTCSATRTWAALGATQDVYGYQFADDDAPSPYAVLTGDMVGGATHAAELPYLFGGQGGAPLTPEQQELARQMRAAWLAFAATGDPSTADLPEWTTGGAVMRLAPGASAPVDAEQFAAEHNCALWTR